MSDNSLLTQIRELPVSEQVDLLRDVGDSLVDSGETAGLTREQQRDLDQRLQRHQESPEDVVSWEQARRDPVRWKQRIDALHYDELRAELDQGGTEEGSNQY